MTANDLRAGDRSPVLRLRLRQGNIAYTPLADVCYAAYVSWIAVLTAYISFSVK